MDCLYNYPKGRRLSQAIPLAVDSFRAKYGYNPDKVLVRSDELHMDDIISADLKLEVVIKGLPPQHFKLGPAVVKRRPRIIKIDRRPVI
jgi:hypothetical protein